MIKWISTNALKTEKAAFLQQVVNKNPLIHRGEFYLFYANMQQKEIMVYDFLYSRPCLTNEKWMEN